MNIRNALNLSTVAVVLAGGTSLMAQVTTGALSGQITDESGNPIAGARVTLESPALFQSRVYNTDAKGEYRALLLPVGNYTIKVSASGKLGKTASDVRVGVGTNLSMSFALKPQKADAAATVEVVTTTAAESKTDDKVSVNYSAEQLLQLPVAMTFNSALQLAPGVSGNGASAQIRGAGMTQIMYRVDGINVQDSSGGGANSGNNSQSGQLYQPLPDSIEDVQVVLSALNARNGLVQGGQMNMVTKSGSNTFEGSIRTYMGRNAWSADALHGSPNDISGQTSEDYSRKTDITLSGPILKDRLWFYVGTRFEPSSPNTNYLGYIAQGIRSSGNLGWDQIYGSNALTIGGGAPGSLTATYLPSVARGILAPMATYGIDPGVDQTVYTGPGNGYSVNNGSLYDVGQYLQTSNKHNHFEGKLTGMVTDAHVLSLTILYDKFSQGNGAGEHSNDPWMVYDKSWVGKMDTKTQAWTLNWNGTLASNWTVEARVYAAKVEAGDAANANPGVSVMGYFASTDPSIMLHQVTNGLGHDWIHYEDGFRYGTVENHFSSYNQPQKTGNNAWTFNVKTFQELGGQHEIDMGAEKVTTIYNFGRTKTGDRAVFQGGWYTAATKTGNWDQDYLYPVFHRGSATNSQEIIDRTLATDPAALALWEAGAGSQLATGQDKFVHWSDAMRGPSAHMEQYWSKPSDSNNSTTSFWVNDIWTINSRWNVLLGGRFNKLILQNQGGDQLDSSNMFEPRAQIKFNPDGKNKEVYSFSVAKLASAYSDAMANNFRGNEWEIRTVHRWTGAGLEGGQPSMGAGDTNISGAHNGYTYTGGTDYHGVRFVNYSALVDTANYGPSTDIFDNSQNMLAKDFKAPYTIEYNLGYQRNYDTGWFKLSLVNRTYKDAWVNAYRDYGQQFLVLMHSPKPGDDFQKYKGTVLWANSVNDQKYDGIEISFQKSFTPRLSLGGSYTLAQMTGVNDNDYYNWKSLRETLLTPEQRSTAVGEGYLLKTNSGSIWLTYVHPVGKGNVSFSAIAQSFLNNATGSVVAASDYKATSGWNSAALPSKINGIDVQPVETRGGGAAGGNGNLYYNTYFGKMGDYKAGVDYYQVNAKIQADIPIGLGKTRLIGNITLNNLFNHAILTNPWGMMVDANGNARDGARGIQDSGVAGRYTGMYKANHTYGMGSNGNYSDWSNGAGQRNVGEFSIGLKF